MARRLSPATRNASPSRSTWCRLRTKSRRAGFYQPAVCDDVPHLPQVVDVGKRIRADDHDVSQLARFDRAQPIAELQNLRTNARRSCEHVRVAETGLLQKLELRVVVLR